MNNTYIQNNLIRKISKYF